MKDDLTEKELLDKITALGDISEDQRNAIVCALIGHSKIQKHCFGYFYCARCGDLLGDKLGGYYDTSDAVIVGHNCEVCRANYKKLSWKDKLFCPDPFKEETEDADT